MVWKTIATLLGVALLGCVEDSAETPQTSECVPGSQQTCQCAGEDGVQFCTELGLNWSDCFCQGAGGETKQYSRTAAPVEGSGQASKLGVVWYSDDPYVAERLCLMYTQNAKTQGWFNDVRLVVWGPSQKLLTENNDVQTTVKQMMNQGVVVEACQACAELYGLVDELEALGITVKYMGQPLTDMLKSEDWSVLTF